jgi:hypothetical protein
MSVFLSTRVARHARGQLDDSSGPPVGPYPANGKVTLLMGKRMTTSGPWTVMSGTCTNTGLTGSGQLDGEGESSAYSIEDYKGNIKGG